MGQQGSLPDPPELIFYLATRLLAFRHDPRFIPSHMKACLVLLSSAFLFTSCVHTAVSPVANPEGVPVVIRVPGVRAGEKPSAEKIQKIDQKVNQEITKNMPTAPEDPGIIMMGTLGAVGDVKTKRGEKFVGYMPLIVIRSIYDPEIVDRAAAKVAAAYYRAAKKHYQLVPFSEIESKPKTAKP